MNKRVFHLVHPTARHNAIAAVRSAPDGYGVIVQERVRSLDQNAKLHALCTDIAASGLTWCGKKRDASEWKVLLVSGHSVATNYTPEVVPGIEGEMVNIRESTATMSRARAASLIEYIQAFCAANDVTVQEHY